MLCDHREGWDREGVREAREDRREHKSISPTPEFVKIVGMEF